MNNPNLSLEVSDTLNLKTMRVFDTSCLSTDQSVENYLLEVLPVNKNNWLTFKVLKGFSFTFNSSNLKYKVVSNKNNLIDLPDGIYEFKLSYKPNIQTFVHYYHLRVSSLKKDLYREYYNLLNNKCNLSNLDYSNNKSKLRDIEEYLISAKWAVEECGDKVRGKELYEFAKKLLKDYTNECGC